AGPLVGVKLVIVGVVGTVTPFRNASRTFAVVRWIRGSTRNCAVGPGTSSRPQLHETVPALKTHAPLGAWYTVEFVYFVEPSQSVNGDCERSVWFVDVGPG